MRAVILKFLAYVTALLTLLFGWIGNNAAPAAPSQTAVVKSDALNRWLYADFYADAQPLAVIPGLKEKMIPQGIAYSDPLGDYLVSGCYDNGALPSALCVLDGESGALQKFLCFANKKGEPQTGHFGGVAAWGDYIYASCGAKLYVYETAAVSALQNGTALPAAAVFALPDVGSFCTAGNGWLLTGTFISNEDAEKTAGVTVNGEKLCAVLHAYRLDPAAPYGIGECSGDKLLPAGEALIPNEVQGAALTADGRLYLCCSYGRNKDSRVFVFADADSGAFSGNSAFSPGTADKVYTAPPMAEGMSACPGGVALLFESGAAKYRLQFGLCPVDRVMLLHAAG